MLRALIISLSLALYSNNAFALAWNREAKKYYIMTQYIMPSKYFSHSGSVSIDSLRTFYKTYIEYGINKNWMIILDLHKADFHDVINVNAIYPYNLISRAYLPYSKYSGNLGVSYQIARDDSMALSAQLGYKSGDYIGGNKSQHFNKYEEIYCGVTKGISRSISKSIGSYLEFRYTPSLYYRAKVYSPETAISLGVNLNKKVNLEIGVMNKMNNINIKNSPYVINRADMPNNFGYLAEDINSLLRSSHHNNIITMHCKLGYQFNIKHGLEVAVYKNSTSNGERNTTYSIGYVLTG